MSNPRSAISQFTSLYDCIDSNNSESEENGAKFMHFLNVLKRTDPESSPDQSEEESDSSADEEDIDTLRLRLQELLTQFPVYALQMKAMAYQFGIYEPKNSIAYDPQVSSFFRNMDAVADDKLPAEIATFCHVMEAYVKQKNHLCERSEAIQPNYM